MKHCGVCCDCLFYLEGDCPLDEVERMSVETVCESYEPFNDTLAPSGASIEEEALCSRCHQPSGLMRGGNTWYFCDLPRISGVDIKVFYEYLIDTQNWEKGQK